MRGRLGLIAGGAAVAAAVLRAVRRRPAPQTVEEPDTRADELRQRIAESRAIVDERDEFEAAETTVDEADASVDERRRSVHDRARAAIDDMQPPSTES